MKRQPMLDIYKLAFTKSFEIEAELKYLNRWDEEPLSANRFEDMGAFGVNTMTFEQWLQFVLIPRIRIIVKENGNFPDNSMVGTYAIRALDGDPLTLQLHDILYKLDELINGRVSSEDQSGAIDGNDKSTVELNSTTIPTVVFTLAKILPQFQGDDLENQLQTFDTFANILAPSTWPIIGDLLLESAQQCSNLKSKQRIETAASAIRQGKPAVVVYDHDDAMKKYAEDHRKSFPSL